MLHRGSSCYVLLVLPVLTTVSGCTDSPKHSLNCNVQIDCMSLNTKIQGLFHLWNCWLWSNLDGNLIPWYPKRLNSMVLFLFLIVKFFTGRRKIWFAPFLGFSTDWKSAITFDRCDFMLIFCSHQVSDPYDSPLFHYLYSTKNKKRTNKNGMN